MSLGIGASNVTVVIPTFNRSEFLRDAVKSCLRQTVPCKIIVVDHGSSDDTPEVARSFGGDIDYVRRDVDSGPEFAWIDGLLRTTTKYAKILHDDDWLEPDFLRQGLLALTEDCAFVISNASIVEENGAYIRPAVEEGLSEVMSQKTAWATKRMSKRLFSPSQMLFRTADLLDGMFVGVLPFQRHAYFGAGPDHFMKLLAMTRYPKWAYIPEELVSFRAHLGSITVNATTNDSWDQELNLTYRDVHDHYRMLRLLQRLRVRSVYQFGHATVDKARRVSAFTKKLANQVKRNGLVPLRFQKKRREPSQIHGRKP